MKWNIRKDKKTDYIKWILPIFCILVIACHTEKGRTKKSVTGDGFKETIDTTLVATGPSVTGKSRTALYLDSLGLIDIRQTDSSIIIKLMYATPDNFTGELLYDDLQEAYLHPDALVSLICAQQLLKEKHPGYSLIVYDAARPMSVQKKMWNVVKGTSKSIYVSNPSRGGGLHNYGLAVDVSIVNEKGEALSMGTEVDHLGPEAHITNEAELVRSGTISKEERRNRQLLRQIMRKAGFRSLNSEWWHFNRCSREEAKLRYKRIE